MHGGTTLVQFGLVLAGVPRWYSAVARFPRLYACAVNNLADLLVMHPAEWMARGANPHLWPLHPFGIARRGSWASSLHGLLLSRGPACFTAAQAPRRDAPISAAQPASVSFVARLPPTSVQCSALQPWAWQLACLVAVAAMENGRRLLRAPQRGPGDVPAVQWLAAARFWDLLAAACALGFLSPGHPGCSSQSY